MVRTTEQMLQKYASTSLWETACAQGQRGLLDVLIQTGSELFMKEWPTLLNVKAVFNHIVAIYGTPS